VSKHKKKMVADKKVLVDFEVTPGIMDMDNPPSILDISIPVEVDDVVPLDPERVRYSFGTVSKCPRCGSTNTIATSTVGQYQYRVCRQPACRWRYKVFGTKI
jgi:hypothetical protein